MRGFLKKFVAVLLSVSIIALTNSFSDAVVQNTEKVRIGLFYTDSLVNINTAVSSFNICAEKGIQLGIFSSDKFDALLEEVSNNPVTIRKDAYFVNNNNVLTEYNPADKPVLAESAMGPYHIKLCEGFEGLDKVKVEIESIAEKGITAYPVFADKWQIWTGFYTDKEIAQLNLDNLVKKKLGDGVYSVVEPSSTRIGAFDGAGNTLLIFDGTSGVFQVHPRAENNPYVFKINNKSSFRGDLEVRRFAKSDMTVINITPFEQYLYGVVPSEIESNSNPEALKAQAVASRTYTLNNFSRHGNLSFDLCTSVHCHVYKGYSGEAAATNKAVDDTMGQRVMFNGKLAQVFYFSSDGGKTEDAVNVWTYDIPYLKSVDDPYESGKSHNYTWEVTLTSQRIKEIMLNRGYDLGDILSMTITKTSQAGRAIELVIKGTKNQRVYTKEGCRTVFGLNSQWYTISTDADVSLEGTGLQAVETQLGGKNVLTASGLGTVKGDGTNITLLAADGVKKAVPLIPTSYTLSGRGWGHAIGMSQEGAKGMANAGFTYKEILGHFFTGTAVE